MPVLPWFLWVDKSLHGPTSAKIVLSMKTFDDDTEAPGWKELPITLWTYFAALASSVVVAVAFSTFTFHPKTFYIVLYVGLLAGLLTGSRACRWLLTLLSAFSAYGLLVIQIDAFYFPDLLLMALFLTQAVLLCASPARAFASGH